MKSLLRRIPGVRRIARMVRRMVARKPVLGMTTLAEQNYLEHYSKNVFTGAGEIVDLGCWLGSTTIPLAKGLSKNRGAGGKRVQAYDQFIWQAWMDPYLAKVSRRYQPGQSFLDEFLERTRRHAAQIDVHAGDLLQMPEDARPIEFLLVDVMKSWRLAAFVVERYFSRLIPGAGVVLHQDFKHYYTPWIHLIQWRLRDSFEVEANIPGSGSLAFRLVRPLATTGTDWLERLTNADDAEVDSAFDYSMSIVDRESCASVAAAKVMFFTHLGRLGDARRTLEGFLSRALSPRAELERAERFLIERELSGNPLLAERRDSAIGS